MPLLVCMSWCVPAGTRSNDCTLTAVRIGDVNGRSWWAGPTIAPPSESTARPPSEFLRSAGTYTWYLIPTSCFSPGYIRPLDSRQWNGTFPDYLTKDSLLLPPSVAIFHRYLLPCIFVSSSYHCTCSPEYHWGNRRTDDPPNLSHLPRNNSFPGRL